MFSKLRLKLTLINVAVIITLFIILISGVYTLLHFNSQRASDYILKKIADSVQSNKLTDLPSRRNRDKAEGFPGFIPPLPRPNFFFVKTDVDGTVRTYSSSITITEEELSGLVNAALLQEDDRDSIEYNRMTFDYLKVPRADVTGTLLVFNDLSDEKNSMRTFLINLLLVGLFCSLLSFFASFFMAKHAIKPIQYALTQQKNFVSDASHELRTPLTIMQTNLDILNSAPPDDTIENNRKWLNNMQDEATRMTELINSLLFLARADANHQLLEKEYFSLNDIILSAVNPFELIAKNKNITLETDMQGVFTAFGDPARIKQVLTILIDNALRYTPANGNIVTACKKTTDFLQITVTDSGEGISEEDLEKIFNRFYQTDESRNKGGAGLGLPIAKWIVEHHHGIILAQSQLEKGTTITIKLPHAAIKREE